MKKFSLIILALTAIILIIYFGKQFYYKHELEENAKNNLAINELNLALKQVQDAAADKAVNIDMDSLITHSYAADDRLNTIARLIQLRDSLLFIPKNDSVTITQ